MQAPHDRVLWKRTRDEYTVVVPAVLWVRPVAQPTTPVPIDELERVLQRLQPQLQPVVHDLTRGEETDWRDPRLTPLAQLTLCCLAVLPGSDVPQALAAIDRWGDLLRKVVTDDGPPHPDDAIDSIACYVLEVTEVTVEQMQMAFAKHLPPDQTTRMTTANKLRLEGRLQGLAEGKAEGKADTLLRQLRRRFGLVPEPLVTRITAASIADLDAWSDAVLDATSLVAVFQPPQA
jgi:hypothetical protein